MFANNQVPKTRTLAIRILDDVSTKAHGRRLKEMRSLTGIARMNLNDDDEVQRMNDDIDNL